MKEKQAELTIENDLGLHARAATVFVQVASRFESEIFLMKDGREVNGKSIIGILTLLAPKGSSIQIRVVGEDAEQALEAIKKLVKDKFGEDH